MKLVIKNQQGENLDFNVLPEDTFLDIQTRLLQNGKVILDLAKLSTGNKPFSLSANVMDYFGIENKTSQAPKREIQYEPEMKSNVELNHITEESEDTLQNTIEHEYTKHSDDGSNWEELQKSINSDLTNDQQDEELVDQSQIKISSKWSFKI